MKNPFSISKTVADSADRQGALFDAGEVIPPDDSPPPALPPGTPRLRSPNRQQIEFRACAWNDLLPEDHEARIAWSFVEGLDLSPILQRIGSVAGEAGRPAIDPKILTALWLYEVPQVLWARG